MASGEIRVITDNDYAGDPDGLFQLVHLLLCSTADVRAVIPSAFAPFPGDPWNDVAADEAARLVLEAFTVTGRSAPVARASNTGLVEGAGPIDNEASRAIVAEAMRDDDRPLLMLIGGGLTALASAWLLEPRIAERLTAVWIGGCVPGDACASIQDHVEYNTSIDPIAARIVFNESDIGIWQVPHSTYTQSMVSWDELELDIYSLGAIGSWLREKMQRIEHVFEHIGLPRGECFVLGDSPLVLLSCLRSPFSPDPNSSPHVVVPAPLVTAEGRYIDSPAGRPIRRYTGLDTRLLMADFTAKLRRAQ